MGEHKATLSKVTPNPRRQHLMRQRQFALLVLVCLTLLVFMFMPNKSKGSHSNEAHPSSSQDMTLSQNLELIERMKREERNKLLNTNQQQTHHEESNPPKRRTKSDVLSKEMRLRINAPVSFDIEGIATASTNTQTSPASKTLTGTDENSQFINNQSDITSVAAKKLPHPRHTIPAGEMIPATLETAINSELPGMTRAITTRDVYSLMGGHLLIPKGSTLVGQFSSGIVEGQSRILVVWNRVQLSDGIIVTLNSPGTDTLGRSGQVADIIERHVFERFGASALLSVLGAYAATAGVGPEDQYNSASQYRMALANSVQNTSGQTLEHSITIKPTLHINQGTPIQVFVAHDLDFTLPKTASRERFMNTALLRFSPGSEGLLSPLLPWLSNTTVSEILINQPEEVYIESKGEMKRYDVPSLTQLHLKRLFLFIANEHRQPLNESTPMLSGNLYDGSRIQLITPPATKHYTLAIRRQSVKQMTLNDYKDTSFYSETQAFKRSMPDRAYLSDEEKQLMTLYQDANWPAFIEYAILLKKNIIISGETSSGKTTFLNACLQCIPLNERIITLEDAYELKSQHPNRVAMAAPKTLEGQACNVSMQDLVQSALRLRPDRLIMGEVRGREILDFISACSTGHEGSITSIHASNPRVAFMRMIQMYKLNNVPSMRDDEIEAVLNEVVDIILQVKKTPLGRKLCFVYYKQVGC